LRIGILSRGYGRKTYGYINVQDTHTAADVGDEPLQYRKKFPEMLVAVGEQRAFAIPRMLSDEPKLQTILLDDAYQHQAVQAGLTVLLTEYRHPYSRDFLLPLGRLREYRSGYKRADIIVVTKCPDNLTQADADALIAELKPLPHQKVFFSKYRYGQPYHLFRPDDKITLSRRQSALLICGIAKTDYLTDYLARTVKSAYLYDFDDHHYFDTYDVGRLQGIFENLSSEDEKIILTTEKDATRLLLHAPYLEGVNLPIYVLPIEVEFLFGGSTQFDETIRQFLLDFKV
jgi:tetraacyldisaccharide 4'-kinase